MLIKAPRWVLILEAALLIGALLGLGYKALIWIQPLSGLEKTPHAQKMDAQTRLQGYFRAFPERYIQLERETWRYDRESGNALHTFTLKNTSTVTLASIQIRFDYDSATGKRLASRIVAVPGQLVPRGILNLKELAVRDVPADTERVWGSVVAAKAVN